MLVSQATTGTASFGQVAIVTGVVTLMYVALALILWRERTGRTTPVGRLAEFVGRIDGVPRWAALSPYIHVAALLAAAFGVWWDIAEHIDNGRDAGPFGTPAHYPIFFGLLGIIVAGMLPIALAREPLPAGSIRLAKGWRVPTSALLITICGTFSLAAFPMDDLWHRLFGEDVTLWGPTHLLMIGGAVFSIFARLLAVAELDQLLGPSWRRRMQEVISVGALLIAWDLFSTEFNYGVPQFPLILQPILIVFGAAMAFTLLRSRRGPGVTFGALLVYLVIRGGIAYLVDQPLGESLGHFPLLIAEALLVELVALALGNKDRFRLGVAGGALIGTVGVLVEYRWSHVWMPISWPSSMLPSALGFGLVTGVGAGLIGAWLATRLTEVAGEPPPPTAEPSHQTAPADPLAPSGRLRLRTHQLGGEPTSPTSGRVRRRTHQLGAIGLLMVGAAVFFCVPRTAEPGVSATLSFEPATATRPGNPSPGDDRTHSAHVTVRLEPYDAAEGARWFEATAWQGGGLVVSPMAKVSDGVYRTTEPLPLSGEWKSMIRLHRGQRDMVSVWVYAPDDAQLGKSGVLAVSGERREFLPEQQVLRREERTDVPPWAWNTGYAVLAMVGALEVAAIIWLIGRAARTQVVAQSHKIKENA